MNEEDHPKKAIDWDKAIKLLDSTVNLISCGCIGFSKWDYEISQSLFQSVDFHSIHLYTSDGKDQKKKISLAQRRRNGNQDCRKSPQDY